MVLPYGYKLLVVGSGFFGATIAYNVATELGLPVLVLERRSHLGGNSYSEVDSATGIEYHRYGSHLFHTSSSKVWDFINRFSAFTNYRHRVFTRHNERTYTMPINLMTINNFFGTNLTPTQARTFVAQQVTESGIGQPSNLEEKAISLIGRPLYEAFVRGYTAKQWETDPSALPPEIITRLPVRFNFNDFYFSDTYEGVPADGYEAIFKRMLTHPNIHVTTECDFFEVRGLIDAAIPVVYTGPVDRFYDYQFGELGWRTLDFEVERLQVDDFQGAAVVNYPDPDVAFTRIHEFKHLHPERRHSNGTLIMKEYSRFAARTDEPFYPIGRSVDKQIYEQYRTRSASEDRIVFGGRLGTYRYLDMHQAIGAALQAYEFTVAPMLTGRPSDRQAWET